MGNRSEFVSCGLPNLSIEGDELVYSIEVQNIHGLPISVHTNLLADAVIFSGDRLTTESQAELCGPQTARAVIPREICTCDATFFLKKESARYQLDAVLIVDDPWEAIQLPAFQLEVSYRGGCWDLSETCLL